MNFNVTELRAIAMAGGGIVMNATGFNTTELRSIAAAANTGGAQFVLKNLGTLTVTELRAIATAGGGKVLFDLSG